MKVPEPVTVIRSPLTVRAEASPPDERTGTPPSGWRLTMSQRKVGPPARADCARAPSVPAATASPVPAPTC